MILPLIIFNNPGLVCRLGLLVPVRKMSAPAKQDDIAANLSPTPIFSLLCFMFLDYHRLFLRPAMYLVTSLFLVSPGLMGCCLPDMASPALIFVSNLLFGASKRRNSNGYCRLVMIVSCPVVLVSDNHEDTGNADKSGWFELTTFLFPLKCREP